MSADLIHAAWAALLEMERANDTLHRVFALKACAPQIIERLRKELAHYPQPSFVPPLPSQEVH